MAKAFLFYLILMGAGLLALTALARYVARRWRGMARRRRRAATAYPPREVVPPVGPPSGPGGGDATGKPDVDLADHA